MAFHPSPIPTVYQGYTFRSRLEARWAVYLDTLGVRWQYEHEGFELGSLGRYLPDFYFPDIGIWAEVKPERLDYTAFLKARSLPGGCVMLDGDPAPRYFYASPGRMDDPALDDPRKEYAVYLAGSWWRGIDLAASQKKGRPWLSYGEAFIPRSIYTEAVRAARSHEFRRAA